MKLPSIHIGIHFKIGKANRGISFATVGNKIHLRGTGTNTELYIDNATAQVRACPASMKKSHATLTDGAATLTVAQLQANDSFHMVTTAARAVALDTAANIVAGFSNLAVGDMLGPWTIATTATTAGYTITLSGSSGAATGHSLVATPGTHPALKTYIVMTNVTTGTAAYTIYTDRTA